MGIISTVVSWVTKLFTQNIKKEFGVETVESTSMREAISTWIDIYQGRPKWLSQSDAIKTIKFAKFICSETAKLVCLDIGVAFSGKRKQYMTDFWEKSVVGNLQNWVEYGIGFGTLILKPNGEGVDFITPDRFEITSKDGNGLITGVVFQDRYEESGKYYTKLERHQRWSATVLNEVTGEYESKVFYKVENKAFISKNSTEIGRPISLFQTRWNMLEPETYITTEDENGLTGMLFGVFKMPIANEIDLGSPYGVSIFHNAIEELRDLDIAYSRDAEEIISSKRISLVDEKLLDKTYYDENRKRHTSRLTLPRFVKGVRLNQEKSEGYYQEINPTLNTSTRWEGINKRLSLIGRKCGYSNGAFVLDEKTGMVTATQVEADDRDTIETIKSIRDALKVCINQLLYAQSIFMDLYNLAPRGSYTADFNFGDITYSYEEDRQNWWKYVQAGKVPAWRYFVKFEGMSEDEAKEMEAELEEKRKNAGGLFGEE